MIKLMASLLHRYLKFGIGRAMFESAQEINSRKEEGLSLIENLIEYSEI